MLRPWRRPCFPSINAIILMPQIFDVIANGNARYKSNELELGDNMFVIERFAGINFTVPNLDLPQCVSGVVAGEIGICDSKTIQLMQAIHSNTNRVIVTLIHCTFFTLLRRFAKNVNHTCHHCFYDINTMILMTQIFDAIDNGNAC